jgi:hypothetical protein
VSKTPKLPFDAYRVTSRPDGFLRTGVTVTKVQVREMYPHSRLALIGCGRNLGIETTVPFKELHSTAKAAGEAVAALIPSIEYKRQPTPAKPRG